MCGIVALLSKYPSSNILAYLVDGIKMLQNRGYDSCGGVLHRDDTTYWSWKGASRSDTTAIERLEQEVADKNLQKQVWQMGIFQTRWATHGGKTDKNAHPHSDKSKRFHLVHNGIITNYSKLKQMLLKKGYEFQSETDTEVVVHMMVDCLVSMPLGTPLLDVWKSVISHLEGTWALIMSDRENPNCLFVAKNGSPLILSHSDDGHMIGFSSELHGIRFQTRQYEEIKDGAVFVVDESLHVDAIRSAISEDGIEQHLASTPYPYSTWTELEINQQEQSLWNALNHGGRLSVQESQVKLGGLERYQTKFQRVRHLILIGCGTSLYAAQFAARVFRTVTTLITVQTFDAAEFSSFDIQNIDVEQLAVVVVSQSGETKDCMRAMQMVKEKSILVVGVVNVVGSSIARSSDCGVYLNAGREVGVASTKSFTSQCVVLTLIALWMSSLSNNSISPIWALRVYNISNVFACNLHMLEQYAIRLVNSVVAQRSIFVLGRGYSHSIALEAALKMKELTYKNVEGYSGGALKHGPFSVLDQDATVFLHCWEGPDWDHMISAAEQVSSRHSHVVILHNSSQSHQTLLKQFPEAAMIHLPVFDEWSASLLSIVFYQFLALYTAKSCGLNPDQPRNLAKVVTVDG